MLKNWLKKWLFKDEPLELLLTEGEVSSVRFSILEDGEVKIFLQWNDDIEGMAEAYATMLFYINNGNYQQSIIDILSNEGEEGTEEQQEFIKTVFNIWGDIIQTQQNLLAQQLDQAPIVPPSKMFGGQQ